MPKKRRKTIVIILTILAIGIGGKFYMDKREAQRQKDLLAVEKTIRQSSEKYLCRYQGSEGRRI